MTDIMLIMTCNTLLMNYVVLSNSNKFKTLKEMWKIQILEIFLFLPEDTLDSLIIIVVIITWPVEKSFTKK